MHKKEKLELKILWKKKIKSMVTCTLHFHFHLVGDVIDERGFKTLCKIHFLTDLWT